MTTPGRYATPAGSPTGLPAGIVAAGQLDPRTGLYLPPGAPRLFRTRGKLGAALENAGTLKIAGIGDSLTAGYDGTNAVTVRSTRSWSARLLARLAAAGALIGEVGSTIADSDEPDPRVNTVTSYSAQTNVGTRTWLPSAVGASFTITTTNPAATALDLEGLGGGTDSIGWQVDGGASTTWTPAAGAWRTLTIPLGAGATHNVKITQQSGAVNFSAWDAYQATGARVLNLGQHGSQAHYAAVAGSRGWDVLGSTTAASLLAQAVAIPAVDLYVVQIGAADLIGGAANVLQAAWVTIVTALQQTGADVLLCVPQPILGLTSLPGRQPAYAAADQLGVPLLDYQTRLGSTTAGLQAAGLIGTDNTHMTATGYDDIARALFGVLTA